MAVHVIKIQGPSFVGMTGVYIGEREIQDFSLCTLCSTTKEGRSKLKWGSVILRIIPRFASTFAEATEEESG